MSKIITMPGDVGLTSNPQGLGKAINWAMSLEGDPAVFGHAVLFVQDPDATSFVSNGNMVESSWTIRRSNLKKRLKRMKIIRHRQMTPDLYCKGWPEIEDNLGMIYPFHRLVLHFLDMLRTAVTMRLFKRYPKWRWASIVTD